MGFWDLVFGWLPSETKIVILGFITFAFIIALVKFIKR